MYKQHDLHMDHATEPVTLMTQLNHNLPHLADPKTAFGFRHVHQLDFATSGVLCVATTKKAAGNASKLFSARLTSKFYLALVDGHTPWDSTSCSLAVGEDKSDPRGFRMATEDQIDRYVGGGPHSGEAYTEFHVIARGTLDGSSGDGRKVTKLLMVPQSGRRHQLRVHMNSLGHPIVGDVAYTGDGSVPRMMLHAWRLKLPFPRQPEPVCVGTADPFPFRVAGARESNKGAAAVNTRAAVAAAGATAIIGAVAVSTLRARSTTSAVFVAGAAAVAAGCYYVYSARRGADREAAPAAEAKEVEHVQLEGCVHTLPPELSFDVSHVLRMLRGGGGEGSDVPPPAEGVVLRSVAPASRR